MFDQQHTIYCSGIGGIGLSALARLLQADGHKVSGSDRALSAVTQQLEDDGIAVVTNQDGTAIPEDTTVFIYSAAVPQDHPERKRAELMGLPSITYNEALGQYAEQFETVVAVSGTHGKSTTTAMIANILVDAGKNPSALVGSLVREFNGSNARIGGKELFVVEACEHQAHFLHIHPNVAVITNIEEDHLDFYKDKAAIVNAFQQFIDGMPSDGVAVLNADDESVIGLQSGDRTRISTGFAVGASVQARNIELKEQAQSFQVGDTTFVLDIPGDFNVANALAAIAVTRHLGVSDEQIRQSLAAFDGVWRRFEVLGLYRKAVIVSDYAHHPTEIKKTIHAARGFYPGARVVAIFQPHQKRRTKELLDGFVEALATADVIILEEIYDVAGREEDIDISSGAIVQALEAHGAFPSLSPNHETTLEILDDVMEKGDVVLMMGAGDIHAMAELFELDQ